MPRSASLLECGILTVYDAATLISVSAPTVRRWFDASRLPGSFKSGKERRIPATSLITLLEKNGMPVPQKLLQLAAAYNLKFGTVSNQTVSNQGITPCQNTNPPNPNQSTNPTQSTVDHQNPANQHPQQSSDLPAKSSSAAS